MRMLGQVQAVAARLHPRRGLMALLGVAGCLVSPACGRIGFEPVGSSEGPVGVGATSGANGAGGRNSDGLDSAVADGARQPATGGNEGRSAGGATANSSGGAAANGAGGANPDLGDASAGGAANVDSGGPDACVNCQTPTGLRLSGTSVGAGVGGPGGSPYTDLCPENEVIVGYTALAGADNPPPYLQSLTPLCGRLTLSASARSGIAITITITRGATLSRRGASGTDPQQALCPTDQVMVGFDSRVETYVREVTLLCAPLGVSAGPGGYAISVGAGTALPPVGGAAWPKVPATLCPPGQLVRGTVIRAGQLIDAVSLACARPAVAYAAGARCSTADDCVDGLCSGGTCAPLTCTAASNCTCAVYERTEYAFCAVQKTRTAALAACAGLGMRLARVDSDSENGWVRGTATARGVGVLQLGGDSLAVATEWRWPDGTLFWKGDSLAAPVNGIYSHWRPYMPDPSPACTFMDGDAWWASVPCPGPERYVCKSY